jgi:hypothetical protein
MEDTPIYDSIDKWAVALSTKWERDLDTPNAPDNILEILYELALDLADELAAAQIASLPIVSIRTFLLAKSRGITPEALVYCYLTSPTDSTSFATLKKVYEPKPKPTVVTDAQVIH